jgi:hypothetical protein
MLQTQKFLNGLEKVNEFMDAVDTLWGITETFGELVIVSCTAINSSDKPTCHSFRQGGGDMITVLCTMLGLQRPGP